MTDFSPELEEKHDKSMSNHDASQDDEEFLKKMEKWKTLMRNQRQSAPIQSAKKSQPLDQAS